MALEAAAVSSRAMAHGRWSWPWLAATLAVFVADLVLHLPISDALALLVAAGALLGGALLAQRFLLVASVENIHYPQYALLALLLARGGVTAEASWLGVRRLIAGHQRARSAR